MDENEMQELIDEGESHDDKKKIFSIKEANGMLMKNESKLIVVRFDPTEEKIYNMKQNCYLNNSYKNNYVIIIT